MGDLVDIRDFSKNDARTYAVGFVDEVIDFVVTIEKLDPGAGFVNSIMQLQELRQRVVTARPRIIVPPTEESEALVYPTANALVKQHPNAPSPCFQKNSLTIMSSIHARNRKQ